MIKSSLYNCWSSSSFTFYSVRFLFLPCVYIINIKFSKMMHHKILSKEFSSEFYADDSLFSRATCILTSQKMIVVLNIVLIKMVQILDQQKENLSDWFWYKKWKWNSNCWSELLCLYRRVDWRNFMKIIRLFSCVSCNYWM